VQVPIKERRQPLVTPKNSVRQVIIAKQAHSFRLLARSALISLMSARRLKKIVKHVTLVSSASIEARQLQALHAQLATTVVLAPRTHIKTDVLQAAIVMQARRLQLNVQREDTSQTKSQFSANYVQLDFSALRRA
jgi:hypothetical protein